MMSFGGFFGSGGGGEGRLLVDNPYTNNMPNLAAFAHQQLLTTTPPLPPPHVFTSSSISLAIKPKMEGLGDQMGLLGGNFDTGTNVRAREDEIESRSESDNNLELAAASGDDQEAPANTRSRRGKKYHRHTPYQIQELEASFKENPHPDEKQRLELGRKLSLEPKQVKFWFQNRRTQMKTQLERHENQILKQENDKLRIENIAIKEAMRNPICSGCGGAAILGEISIEEHNLRIENARLKEELNRICVLANKFLGRPLSSLGGSFPPLMPNSGLELAVGRTGFDGLGPAEAALPMGFDFGNGISNALNLGNMVPASRPMVGVNSLDIGLDKSVFFELAMAAMNELVKLAQIDEPLWIKSLDGSSEMLNIEEYNRTVVPCIDMKPRGLIIDGTRANGISTFNSLGLVEMLMDANQWTEMFPGLIGSSSTLDIISSGTGGTRNGALQLMHAEMQVISPLVPVRQIKFLRFCKQHAEGIWAVVDVSVDGIREVPNAHSYGQCRRLPSGCIVQDMPNGFSKVTWVEHCEYDESAIHHLYRPLLRLGMGFGAQRWVGTLQRQCDFFSSAMSNTVPSDDQSGITPNGRRSIAKLSQRMTRSFCAGVCGTVHKWEVVQVGNMGEGARLMIRKGVQNPGEHAGVVLSATMSVWMPVQQHQLFDLLQNEQLRSRWDVLSNGGPMQQMVRIPKGQDRENCISLLRATASNSSQNNTLILQETSTDKFGSIIVSTAVDIATINMLMNGGDSACVAVLPSGFAIVPDCYAGSDGPNGALPTAVKEGGDYNGSSSGSILTVGFQLLLSNLPSAKITTESVETVNNLINRTIQGIKEALHCN